MPYRWYTCPFGVYTIDADDSTETARMAKVASIRDTGRATVDEPLGRYYQHRPVLLVETANGDWCVCLVKGVNWSNLDADAEMVNLFSNLVNSDFAIADGNLRAFHLQLPSELGWPTARLNRIKQRIIDRGVDVTGLTASSAIWRWLERVGQHLNPAFRIQQIALGDE